MEELIDIVTKEGKPTGKVATKSKIHTEGHYHNTAHIWFYNKEGEILLAQRAASKVICPLLWDVSVAGHVDAGESIEEAAIRETKEELGLSITTVQLQKIGVFKCFQSYNSGILDNEFHHTFIAKLDYDINELTPNAAEVAAVKLVSIDEFKSLLDHSSTNSHFVASNRSYYELVLKQISMQFEITNLSS